MYSTIWIPVLGELLTCKRELDNSEDRYAVAICKVEDTIIREMEVLFANGQQNMKFANVFCCANFPLYGTHM